MLRLNSSQRNVITHEKVASDLGAYAKPLRCTDALATAYKLHATCNVELGPQAIPLLVQGSAKFSQHNDDCNIHWYR